MISAGTTYTAHTTINLDDWLAAGLTYDMYKNDRKRGYLHTMNRAGNGREVLIMWDSLRTDRKDQIMDTIGDPVQRQMKGFADQVEHNDEALTYFRDYRLEDGRSLPPEVINEYYANACVLAALSEAYNKRMGKRRRSGGTTRGVWESVVVELNNMPKDKWNHTLPSHPRRLRDRMNEFMQGGYMSLIHKGYGNQNRRKVTGDLERLLISLYCQDTKPFVLYVHELYHQFLGGVVDIFDVETGEIFQREDFIDDRGRAIEISDSTVWNYVNLPKNRRIVDKFRSGTMQYNSAQRPHHHRKSPDYAFSKISMDDRDLPRKMGDGRRVKAYYSYDVASGCVIGAAYSKLKDATLFIDCMRDMFRFIDAHNLPMPYEVEVEHHLVRNFKDDLMQAGTVFPFVRWCNPANSQEKRAEHFNRAKKLGTEKKLQAGIGRPFARMEAHRTIQEKVFDEHNNTYKTPNFTFDELVADDKRANEIYNNSPHPNQKKYPGMTRMDVLLNNTNPMLEPIEQSIIARYIGEPTSTTIRRNQYVTVQYQKYQLSHPDKVGKLEPNNMEVTAYWIPAEDGSIETVYLYQNGNYIDSCKVIEGYQEAEIEKTERDAEIYTEQTKYVSQFDKSVRDGKQKVAKVRIMPRDKAADPMPEILDVTPDGPVELTDDDFNTDYTHLTDYARKAIESL